MIQASVEEVRAAAALVAKLCEIRLNVHAMPGGYLEGKRVAIVHIAPQTYEGLRRVYEREDALAATTANSGTSMYPTPEQNAVFRLHHDLMHLMNRRTFSYDDEVLAAQDGWADLAQEMGGMSPEGKRFVRAVYAADTIGQAAYFQKWGEHVQDQLAFVMHYLETGNLPEGRM